MKFNQFLDTKAGGMVALGVVIAGFAYYNGKKIKEGAEYVGNSVNPNSEKNLVYKGVNAVGSTLTGDKNFNLGSWIYDKVNGG